MSVVVDVVFWAFGVAAIWFGWRVFRTDSMVRASFSLLASFLCVGAIMLLLWAEYLGVATFFMMAVEMTVMALFMVAFMMNPAGLNPMSMVHHHRLAIGLGGVGTVLLLWVAAFAELPATAAPDPSRTIDALGTELLGGSMLVFETAGVTLLATMVGAVVLSARSSRFDGPSDEGSLPPPVDPDQPDRIEDLDDEEDEQ